MHRRQKKKRWWVYMSSQYGARLNQLKHLEITWRFLLVTIVTCTSCRLFYDAPQFFTSSFQSHYLVVSFENFNFDMNREFTFDVIWRESLLPPHQVTNVISVIICLHSMTRIGKITAKLRLLGLKVIQFLGHLAFFIWKILKPYLHSELYEHSH